MTTQVDLQKVWALTGGAIDPGSPKYEDGWVVEIPTYQHFNYVLQNLTKNILVGAEQGCYDWQAEITYAPGAKVVASNGIVYLNRLGGAGFNPILDASGTWWIKGRAFGSITPAELLSKQGVYIKDVSTRISATTWDCTDLTISGQSAVIQYNTNNVASKNWLLGNITGEMVAVDLGVGAEPLPDGSSYALAEANVHRLYHEGHKPTQSEVSGTIPDAAGSIADDGKMYARRNGTWISVTTTVVSEEPPPPVLGNGAGWYNLNDGQLYVDIDDGTSSQWAPGNPPVIPVVNAADVPYDNSTSGLAATNMQAAIDELAALHP